MDNVNEAPAPPVETRAYVKGGTVVAFEQGFNALRFCRYGPMVYNENDAYVGKSLYLYGEYGFEEFELLKKLVYPHTFVVEVGANIGAHTVPLARHCALIYAFEPQRLVFQALCANLALNQVENVHAWQAAIGAEPGRLYMPELDPRQPYNFGGVSMQTTPTAEAVLRIRLDDVGIRQLVLLKIDVEGMELEVLTGARELITRHRPYIYVENDRPEKSAALIAWLQEEGYSCHWHLPPLYNRDNFARNDDNAFPNVVSVNMLCLPSADMDAFGLRRVSSPADRWN